MKKIEFGIVKVFLLLTPLVLFGMDENISGYERQANSGKNKYQRIGAIEEHLDKIADQINRTNLKRKESQENKTKELAFSLKRYINDKIKRLNDLSLYNK